MTLQINNRGDTTEVLLYDEIGASYWGGTDAKSFAEQMANVSTANIHVRINSPGGNVLDGIAIYNTLKDHDAHVITEVDALAASIASIIMLAGDERRIADNAMVMIHNASTIAVGDAATFRRTADLLDKWNDTLIDTYVRNTGNEFGQVKDWMNEETWFGAEEAKEHGFVTAVSENVAVAAHWFDKTRFRNAPENVFKNMTPEPPVQKPVAWRREAARRRLLTKRTGSK